MHASLRLLQPQTICQHSSQTSRVCRDLQRCSAVNDIDAVADAPARDVVPSTTSAQAATPLPHPHPASAVQSAFVGHAERQQPSASSEAGTTPGPASVSNTHPAVHAPSAITAAAEESCTEEYEMVSTSDSEEQVAVRHESSQHEPAHATASMTTAPATSPSTHASLHQAASYPLAVASSFQVQGGGQSSLSGWQASIQGWVLAAAILFAIRLSRQQTDASRMDVRALQVSQQAR